MLFDLVVEEMPTWYRRARVLRQAQDERSFMVSVSNHAVSAVSAVNVGCFIRSFDMIRFQLTNEI
jgi:hypothetical protein